MAGRVPPTCPRPMGPPRTQYNRQCASGRTRQAMMIWEICLLAGMFCAFRHVLCKLQLIDLQGESDVSTSLSDCVKTRTRAGATHDDFSGSDLHARVCRRGHLLNSKGAGCRYGRGFSHSLLEICTVRFGGRRRVRFWLFTGQKRTSSWTENFIATSRRQPKSMRR
jgi:hypothetical protein